MIFISVHVFSSKHSNIAVCDRWNEQNFQNLKPIIQSGLENDARINTTYIKISMVDLFKLNTAAFCHCIAIKGHSLARIRVEVTAYDRTV
ncbi:hypothetical protein T12_9785 [Trichinella patagoniensis]|uniref:Uncharacterized protein n=1 Tax=Trichinella patagoniensis TaxID=990121 RepID=A0A0V0Z6X4_9BILA|nr:hypothetical protein T12_9785 [Trichinella patagoniensis]